MNNTHEAFNLSPAQIMVFLDGIDAATSNNVGARTSYGAAAIRLNERFRTMYIRQEAGKIGLDFFDFDNTAPVAVPQQHSSAPASRVISATAGGFTSGAANAAVGVYESFSQRARTFATLSGEFAGGAAASAAAGAGAATPAATPVPQQAPQVAAPRASSFPGGPLITASVAAPPTANGSAARPVAPQPQQQQPQQQAALRPQQGAFVLTDDDVPLSTAAVQPSIL